MTQNEVRVKNSKREEIYVIYGELINKISDLSTFEEYFDIYNLFLKFTGNYYHLAEVEFKMNGKYVVPVKYSKYYRLIKENSQLMAENDVLRKTIIEMCKNLFIKGGAE